ncbi:hypothetical protein AU498_06825 [Lonsdalea populi]|uniref:hypothetical protein n=1 Tax=Lonsdalea populi TaxID=1172565 RepID=UPI000DCA6291|nr:hypothetical protein [Lonsdalea populi]RAT53299.1 hypothetical protein AU498_06825 [Lonsdalea populi]RAT54933.1 hypothetical protein AU497_03370 [Lonsdalea populi]
MKNEQEIIEYVGMFMALCSTITTNGSSKPESYQSDYQNLREKLLGTDGLRLPLWIRTSRTPAAFWLMLKWRGEVVAAHGLFVETIFSRKK